MNEVIRQSIGIDCAMGEHVAGFSTMSSDRNVSHVSGLTFKNTKSGFIKLERWIKKHKPSPDLVIVMEATGVYHEQLACFLTERNYFVSVVLPNKAKYFAKTLDIKTVTDKTAAQSLATMGLEKKLIKWKKPPELFNQLRQLTRERDQVVHERSQIKCQLHAESSGAWPNSSSLKRMNQRIKVLDKQVLEIELEIKEAVKNDSVLSEKIEHVCTIKGVGILTAVTVIAETNGFNSIRNKKQLVSYAGLDVKQHSSGISVNKKPRISKHGNKHLRKCLHFPALAAIRFEKSHKELFVRLVSKHGIKMKGAVAIQRKILVLIYTLWKNNTVFDSDYEMKKSKNGLGQSRETALKELA
jgi:transposase